MRAPLWLNIEPAAGPGATFNVSLATCRNCGQVKVASNPCGFDHLAALTEFRATFEDEAESERTRG